MGRASLAARVSACWWSSSGMHLIHVVYVASVYILRPVCLSFAYMCLCSSLPPSRFSVHTPTTATQVKTGVLVSLTDVDTLESVLNALSNHPVMVVLPLRLLQRYTTTGRE